MWEPSVHTDVHRASWGHALCCHPNRTAAWEGRPDIWPVVVWGRRRYSLRDSAGAEQSHHACPSCLLPALVPVPPLPCTCSEAQKGGSGCVVRMGVTVLCLETAGARRLAVDWPCWKAGCTHHAQRQTPVTVLRGPSPPARRPQNARPLWGQRGVGDSL